MSRWGSGVAAALVAALLGATGATGAAQTPPAAAPGGEVAVLELRLPVIDVELPVSSLDGNVSVTGRRVVLQADVLFAFNSATLGRRARSRISAAVSELRDRKPRSVRVVGYTDSKGSDAFNDRLSRRRAAAVERALRRALGSGAPPLRTEGRGEADPVAGNTKDGADDPRGRARNRRVELVYR